MVCRKCGAKLQKGAVYCSKCGTEIGNAQECPAENAGKDSGEKQGGKRPPVAALAIAALVIVVLAAGIIFCLIFRSDRLGEGVSDTAGRADSETVDEETKEENIAPEEEIPLYSIPDVDTIDIYAINRSPAEKAPGMTWDASLFYWLEDVSRESSEDGYLSRCRISKTLLRSSESGQLIQYEVYRDPETGQIYKIVSIEERDGSLLLTDYYYQNGIPNFIFVRQDSIYTPTYATTDKIGERYYFEGDVMVQWRMIHAPGEIKEYSLSPSAVSYVQYDYFQEEESVRSMYDETELRMLNAAYNTYQAVASQTGIGLMEGLVEDTSGAGIGGVIVEIRRKSDNVLLYRTVTGEDGIFRCFVYLDNTECFFVCQGDGTFQEAAVYGIILADSGITGMYGSIVLNRMSEGEYPVHINICMAEKVGSGEDGSLERVPAHTAAVSLRKGVGAREGEIFRSLQVGEGGSIDTALPPGIYTAQIDVPGCARTFLEIRVEEGEVTADAYVLPAPTEGVTAIVLTWEGEDLDLDLTLFTPFQSTEGDMAHIGGGISGDEYGNYLVSDNGAGCEVIYADTAQEGSYKIYVSDYTDSQSGNYDADMLGERNVRIYIYDCSGLVAEYVFPAGQIGVVWEVAQISGGRITPSQRVYRSMEGKSWWLAKKQKKRLVRKNWKGGDDEGNWDEYCYDDLGNLTKLIYHRGDAVNQWMEYSYDSAGKRIKETEYRSGGLVNYEITYDSMGNQIMYEIFNFGHGDDYERRETLYDSQGREVKYTSYYRMGYNEDGSEEIVIDYWTEKSYDSLGREIKCVRYDCMGTDDCVVSWTEMSYDDQGNRAKSVDYNSDGSVREWTEMSYDDRGNMIKRVRYDSGGSVRSWKEISYDSRGNLTGEFSYIANGALLEGWEYAYDDRGNRIQMVRKTSSGLSELYEYSYDSQGNMIEEVCYWPKGAGGDISRAWSAEYLYE